MRVTTRLSSEETQHQCETDYVFMQVEKSAQSSEGAGRAHPGLTSSIGTARALLQSGGYLKGGNKVKDSRAAHQCTTHTGGMWPWDWPGLFGTCPLRI